MEQKKCRQCSADFVVTDDDLAFYDKISPTFGGRKFAIPAPTLCVDCRSQRRLAWRNERVLYNRACDLCGQVMVSLYHQDAPYTVYCQDCFWSDKWNPLENGREFDPARPFLAQWREVQAKVPRINLLNSKSENTDYGNHSSRNKDSYLVFASFDNENLMYARHTLASSDCVDADSTYNKSQYCYECDTVDNCYKLTNSRFCSGCAESHFLYQCKSCKNCYRCIGLRNKQFCFNNEQLTKEEYYRRLPDLGSREVVTAERANFEELVKNKAHVYGHLVGCEESTGDELTNCKHCFNCYDLNLSENCANIDIGEHLKDAADCFGAGPGENLYEIHGMANGYGCVGCHASYYATNLYYADNCQNCQDCFGCVSLKKSQYCILNKQYSKEDYEKKVVEVIERMVADGEWGEFFPTGLSPFAYNETFANYYFPLDRAGAEKIGARWLDQDYSKKYEGETYEPKDNIKDYIDGEEERQMLLSGVLKCEVTGKAYKIMPRELAFYIEQGIPVPTKHPETRFKERFARRNPRKLFKRQCDNQLAVNSEQLTGGEKMERCPNMFETTYAPERTEKVYCESCYQKAVN